VEPQFVDGDIIYALRLDYEAGSEDPARVFRAMALLVDTFYRIDVDLARSVSVQIQPVQLLQEIEAGSIKTWLRTVLRQVDDEGLKNLDWKPLVGQYLVKAKHALLEWLEKHDTVSAYSDLDALEDELLQLAGATDVLHIPAYTPVPRKALLEDLKEVGDATRELNPRDRVSYESPVGETPIRPGFHITSEEIEDLLTAETHSGTGELILLVKKPDYLGSSMWEFRLDGRLIEARMLDEDWLAAFRARRVDIRPGDGLRATVQVDLKRGADGSIVALKYSVLQVHDILENVGNLPIQLTAEFDIFWDDDGYDRPKLPPPADSEDHNDDPDHR
jgi:hypothetical protein